MPSLSPVLFVPDTHAPYHDERAWQLMLKAARALEPEIIVHLGDLADFYRISRFSKDPSRQLDFAGEVAVCKDKLDELGTLGPDRKVFIAGNHEARLHSYLCDKAPELFGFISLEHLFGLEQRGWEYVPYKDDIKIGCVYVTHDVGYSGKYAARRSLETYQHSVVTAHTHRLDYVVEGDSTGERAVSAAFGWLGDVEQVDYMHRRRAVKEWALAFGVGWLERKTGHMFLQPVPIVDYTCSLLGELFVG